MTTINHTTALVAEDLKGSVKVLGNCSYDYVSQLETMFSVIKERADEHTEIKRLAESGKLLANDHCHSIEALMEDVICDVQREQKSQVIKSNTPATTAKNHLNVLIDDMSRKLSQLNAMLNVQSDQKSYDNWSDEIRDHYNWACNDMVEQSLQTLTKMGELKLN